MERKSDEDSSEENSSSAPAPHVPPHIVRRCTACNLIKSIVKLSMVSNDPIQQLDVQQPESSTLPGIARFCTCVQATTPDTPSTSAPVPYQPTVESTPQQKVEKPPSNEQGLPLSGRTAPSSQDQQLKSSSKSDQMSTRCTSTETWTPSSTVPPTTGQQVQPTRGVSRDSLTKASTALNSSQGGKLKAFRESTVSEIKRTHQEKNKAMAALIKAGIRASVPVAGSGTAGKVSSSSNTTPSKAQEGTQDTSSPTLVLRPTSKPTMERDQKSAKKGGLSSRTSLCAPSSKLDNMSTLKKMVADTAEFFEEQNPGSFSSTASAILPTTAGKPVQHNTATTPRAVSRTSSELAGSGSVGKVSSSFKTIPSKEKDKRRTGTQDSSPRTLTLSSVKPPASAEISRKTSMTQEPSGRQSSSPNLLPRVPTTTGQRVQSTPGVSRDSLTRTSTSSSSSQGGKSKAFRESTVSEIKRTHKEKDKAMAALIKASIRVSVPVAGSGTAGKVPSSSREVSSKEQGKRQGGTQNTPSAPTLRSVKALLKSTVKGDQKSGKKVLPKLSPRTSLGVPKIDEDCIPKHKEWLAEVDEFFETGEPQYSVGKTESLSQPRKPGRSTEAPSSARKTPSPKKGTSHHQHIDAESLNVSSPDYPSTLEYPSTLSLDSVPRPSGFSTQGQMNPGTSNLHSRPPQCPTQPPTSTAYLKLQLPSIPTGRQRDRKPRGSPTPSGERERRTFTNISSSSDDVDSRGRKLRKSSKSSNKKEMHSFTQISSSSDDKDPRDRNPRKSSKSPGKKDVRSQIPTSSSSEDEDGQK